MEIGFLIRDSSAMEGADLYNERKRCVQIGFCNAAAMQVDATALKGLITFLEVESIAEDIAMSPFGTEKPSLEK